MGFWTWLASKLTVGGGTPVPSPQQRNPQTRPTPAPRSRLAQPVPVPALTPAPGVTAVPGPLAGTPPSDAQRRIAGASGAPVAVAGVAIPNAPQPQWTPGPVAPLGALNVDAGGDPFSAFSKLGPDVVSLSLAQKGDT